MKRHERATLLAKLSNSSTARLLYIYNDLVKIYSIALVRGTHVDVMHNVGLCAVVFCMTPPHHVAFMLCRELDPRPQQTNGLHIPVEDRGLFQSKNS